MKTSHPEIKSNYHNPSGRLKMEGWDKWEVKENTHIARGGYYVATSGLHAEVRQWVFGDSDKGTWVYLNIETRTYSVKRAEVYSDRGLMSICARFVKDVLQIEKERNK